ncbi:hypothetical protein [Vulcanisaeta sp. JCM 16159]|uniref:hypothetical protein n=1 Tax=Vulcanisaeta sp. JCM 16159 TaxID=1295371 RepID=UPI001FB2E76A|nr:hypothetical protein [Vulcanisaeta sp. JCM 16159]
MVRRNVPILGLPDLIINLDNRPAYIIELKTIGGPAGLGSVKGRDVLQAESYFHMMNYLGLNPRGVAIIKVIRGSDFRIINNIDIIIKQLEGGEDFVRLSKYVTIHRISIRGFDEFLRDVDYAIDYWLGLRNPKPSPSRGLCSGCEHRRYCPYSIVR